MGRMFVIYRQNNLKNLDHGKFGYLIEEYVYAYAGNSRVAEILAVVFHKRLTRK